MHVAYWILAALLALFYLYGGGLKAVRSQEQLRPMMGWVDRTPMPLVRVIGALELAGAAGLVLPPATGVAPWLGAAAAVGLALVQVGGTWVHVARGEARQIGLNLGLLAAAVAAAWLGAALWG